MIERRGLGIDHTVRQVVIGKTRFKGPDNGVHVRLSLGGKSDLTLLKARRKDRTDFDRLFRHIVATNE